MTSSLYNRHKDETRMYRGIVVRGQYEGFHAYHDAPEQVAFLRNSHRHLFKWEANLQVFHNDRELEFFLVKALIEREILPFNLRGDLGSCEQQAEFILEGLVNAYGEHRYFSVSVSEDGENDGHIEWYPHN